MPIARDAAVPGTAVGLGSPNTLRPAFGWLGADWVLVLSAALFACITGLVTHTFGRPWSVGGWDYFRDLPPLSLLFLGIICCVRRVQLHSMPARSAYRQIRREFAVRLAPERLANVGVVAAAISLSIGCFTAWKLLIPNLIPFRWDATFAGLDRALHLGRYPHEWLAPILNQWWAVWVVDFLYLPVWSFVMITLLVGQLWSTPSPRRTQYLLTFALSWIVLGALAATALSSAGPQYFGDVVAHGANPYGGLMDRLSAIQAQHPLIYPTIRQHLWDVYRHGSSEPFAGISAMPSLHVAMSELMAIWGRRESRFFGVALTTLSGITVIGSVVLGAHYAIDGYVSILGVHLLWKLSGYVASRIHVEMSVDRPILSS
jgi:hypothetical protein